MRSVTLEPTVRDSQSSLVTALLSDRRDCCGPGRCGAYGRRSSTTGGRRTARTVSTAMDDRRVWRMHSETGAAG